MRTLLITTTVCLVAACTSPTREPTPTTTSSSASAGKCSEVVKEYATVTDTLIDKGCADDNGALRFGKVKTCKNGQRLWEMNDVMGLSGEPMIPATKKTDDGIPARFLFERICD